MKYQNLLNISLKEDVLEEEIFRLKVELDLQLGKEYLSNYIAEQMLNVGIVEFKESKDTDKPRYLIEFRLGDFLLPSLHIKVVTKYLNERNSGFQSWTNSIFEYSWFINNTDFEQFKIELQQFINHANTNISLQGS